MKNKTMVRAGVEADSKFIEALDSAVSSHTPRVPPGDGDESETKTMMSALVSRQHTIAVAIKRQ